MPGYLKTKVTSNTLWYEMKDLSIRNLSKKFRKFYRLKQFRVCRKGKKFFNKVVQTPRSKT